MKYVLILAALAFAPRLVAGDSLVAVPRTVLVKAANTIRQQRAEIATLRDQLSVDDSLVYLQQLQILDLKAQRTTRDTIITAQRSQLDLYRANEELHKATERALREQVAALDRSAFTTYVPSFVAGLAVGYLLFHH